MILHVDIAYRRQRLIVIIIVNEFNTKAEVLISKQA